MECRILSSEFLAENLFSLKRFPDGLFWFRYYHADHMLQCDEQMTHFTEWDDGWVNDLTAAEFVDIITKQNNAIESKGIE